MIREIVSEIRIECVPKDRQAHTHVHTSEARNKKAENDQTQNNELNSLLSNRENRVHVVCVCVCIAGAPSEGGYGVSAMREINACILKPKRKEYALQNIIIVIIIIIIECRVHIERRIKRQMPMIFTNPNSRNP